MLVAKSYSQELSGISKNEPFTIAGGVSASTVLYHSLDSLSMREPFTYVLNGNMNFNFFGVVNCPLNFTYSNYNENFSHPFNFNQFGIQPSYKWVKTYMGYNTMNFSPYTLNGHQFLGVGVELLPQDSPIVASAMYGRLLKPIEEDTTNTVNIPSFARYGYAFKIGYVSKGDELNLIIFKAYDDVTSLTSLPTMTVIKPEENLAMSLLAKKKILERLFISAEFASTAITDDSRIEEERYTQSIFSGTSFLMPNTIATSYYNAFNTSIKYTGKSYSIGSTYEMVEPGYKTLGAYYFTNDFENITIDASKRVLKNRLNLNGRIGFQRNNLDGAKISRSTKTVGNINAAYAVSQKLNINIAYSNFTGYTHIKNNFDYINAQNPYENLDTLDFTQINQNIAANISYRLGDLKNKARQQAINFSINMQQSAQEQGVDKLPGASFYNTNIAYNINMLQSKLTLFTSLNTNYNDMPASINTFTLGPTVGASKSLLNKVFRVSSSVSYNANFDEYNTNLSSVLVMRVMGTYTLMKQHKFNLSVVALNRTVNPNNNITDLTVMVGYKYNFKTSYNELFR